MTAPHPHAAAARLSRRESAAAIGIDEHFIDLLVERFYARVRADELLGPIFGERIADWPPHLARMKLFWTSILLGDGGFSGNPMLKHVAIPGIERTEFLHWLALFAETAEDLAPASEAAALVCQRARMIADSLLTGIRIHRDGRSDLQAMKGLDHA